MVLTGKNIRNHIINNNMIMMKTYMIKRVFVATKYAFLLGAVAFACFIAGLQHFVVTLPKMPYPTPQNTDGIVVITGGQQRVADGLSLLESGFSKALLVSGVGQGVSKTILADELGLKAPARALLKCCVTLEFEASDTRGNAFAAAHWATANEFKSLHLVTANYHMPRAKYIFTSKMPEMKFYFWPVSPSELTLAIWWKNPHMIRLLAREYAKYLTERLLI